MAVRLAILPKAGERLKMTGVQPTDEMAREALDKLIDEARNLTGVRPIPYGEEEEDRSDTVDVGLRTGPAGS